MSADVAQAEVVARAREAGQSNVTAAIVWILVAIAGEQAAIALYSPGAWQFGFRAPADLRQHPLAIAILLLVALAAVVGLTRSYRSLAASRRAAGVALSVCVIWVLATTLVSRDPAGYGIHLILTAAVHAAGLACIVFAARSIPHGPAVSALLDADGRKAWMIVGVAAAFTTLACGTVALLTFHRIPHVPDEVAYLFQAKTYAHGRVYLDPPPAPELFRQFLIMVHDGKWFSVFPPGWPLVLALGVIAGVPWILNPLLSGAGVLLAYAVVRRVHRSSTALLAALLLATSPLYVTVGATYMAHPLSIVCALLALLSVLELQKGARLRWGVIGGLALGLLFLTRPVEAVSVGVIVLAMCMGAFGARVRAAAVAVAVAASSAVGSLFFINNRILTGNALRDPVQMFFDLTFYPGSNALGFGPDKGNIGWANDILPGHSPLEAAIHLNLNLSIIDTELFGWLGGAVLFIVMLALGKRVRGMWLWICLIVAVLVPPTLYWYSGADLGPRYWYQTLVPFAALTALGVRALADGIGIDQTRVASVALLLAFVGFFQITVWRGTAKYRRYRGVTADAGRLIRDNAMQHGLIFVKDGNPPNDYADYASGFLWSGVPLGNGPIVARYGDASAMAAIHARFPDRKRWIIAPSGAAGRYSVIAVLDGTTGDVPVTHGNQLDNR